LAGYFIAKVGEGWNGKSCGRKERDRFFLTPAIAKFGSLKNRHLPDKSTESCWQSARGNARSISKKFSQK
jgi:hypothetical protein